MKKALKFLPLFLWVFPAALVAGAIYGFFQQFTDFFLGSLVVLFVALYFVFGLVFLFLALRKRSGVGAALPVAGGGALGLLLVGAFVAMFLDGKSRQGFSFSTRTPVPLCQGMPYGIRRISETAFEIEKPCVDEFFAKDNEGFSVAKWEVVKNGEGNSQGVQVSGITTSTIEHFLGFVTGDTVVEANDLPLVNATVYAILSDLQQFKDMKVKVSRNGQSILRIYHFVNKSQSQ